MDIPQLAAFVEAARWGSFRAAASALFLTPAALTERIRKLEDSAGRPLFVRGGRGVRLTEAGVALHPIAQRVLEDLREARVALDALPERTLPVLKIGTTPTLGTYALPPVIDAFRRQYPSEFEVHCSVQVLELVLSGQVQIGICNQVRHPQVETLPIVDDEVALVAPPGHPLATAERVLLSDLVREPVVHFEHSQLFLSLFQRACRDAGVKPRVVMMVDSVEAVIRMVERGLGISFVPYAAIEDHLRSNLISVITLADVPPITYTVAALVLKGRLQEPLIHEFITLLLTSLGATRRSLTQG